MRVDGLNGIVVVGGYGTVGRTVCADLAGLPECPPWPRCGEPQGCMSRIVAAERL